MSNNAKSSKLTELVTKARESSTKRNFSQSFEFAVNLKDIDMKKLQFSLNEMVILPNVFSLKQKICIFASGDLALRAKKSDVDKVIEPEELDSLVERKREAKKLANEYHLFLSEVTQMPKIGKIMGSLLGPRGKMPIPIPPNVAIDTFVKRFSSTARVRSKGQLSAACKVGDENMSDEQIAQNSETVLAAVEKKLPQASNNIKNIVMKLSMSPPVNSKNL